MDVPPIFHIKEELDLEPDYIQYEDSENHSDDNFNVRIKVETRSCIVFEDDEFDLRGKYDEPADLAENDDLKKPKMQECSRCDKVFGNCFTLLQHNLLHLKVILPLCTIEYRYNCNKCTAHYKRKNGLIAHCFYKHQVRLTNSDTLRLYMYHKCEICNRSFTYKAWHAHMTDVHGDRAIFCKICDKSFKSGRYLRNHMKGQHCVAMPEGTVKCDRCPALLRHKYALKTHLNNCHSDQPCICDKCDTEFKSLPYLRTHMKRVHYDDGKKYICECGKSFRSPGYLRIHKKNSH